MIATSLTLWPSLLGGILIGTASAWALVLSGKVPGISGICARIMLWVPGDTLWRALFLLGLIGGAGAAFWLHEPAASYQQVAPLWLVAIAGVLVGLGTRVGGGCTSGHGVCGVGRGSRRSIVATITFVAVAMVTVAAVHAVGGRW